MLSVTRHLLKRYPVEVFTNEWTPKDDDQLRKLVVEKGTRWMSIGEEMGRSPEMVRSRYRDYVSLGKQRNTGPWTVDEMRRLYAAVTGLLGNTEWTSEEGLEVDVIGKYIDWESVASKMGNRSRLQCHKKWCKFNFWVSQAED